MGLPLPLPSTEATEMLLMTPRRAGARDLTGLLLPPCHAASLRDKATSRLFGKWQSAS